jgi:hypothetical protein
MVVPPNQASIAIAFPRRRVDFSADLYRRTVSRPAGALQD